MRVQVRFFAAAREGAKTNAHELTLPEGATLADARAALGAEFPALEVLFPKLRFAIDQEFSATANQPLRDGCELALIPPVGGG